MSSNRSNVQTVSEINAIIPLALLQTLRTVDRTDPVDLEEYAGEIAPRRLGTSPTVAAQIERFEGLVKRGSIIDGDEAIQLFRLVGRRNDADLVFSQAGRMAARLALERLSKTSSLVHKAGLVVARKRVGFARAAKVARKIFYAEMSADETGGITASADPPILGSESEGGTCGLWGDAMAELLRKCTEFDGAFVHRSCRNR